MFSFSFLERLKVLLQQNWLSVAFEMHPSTKCDNRRKQSQAEEGLG
jgi:hypothetical protein